MFMKNDEDSHHKVVLFAPDNICTGTTGDMTPDTSLDAAKLALIKAHCVIRLAFISGTD
jgi:hypothetical protein